MILIASRLGIMACGYLVRGYNENRNISAPEIAEYYNMNVRALMPALRQLTRVGILRSQVGGKEPGFIFAKDPAQFNLYEIFLALEGATHFNCCCEVVPSLECKCADKGKCELMVIFGQMISDTVNRLKSVTIAAFASENNPKKFLTESC